LGLKGAGKREWRKNHNEELHDLYSSPSYPVKIDKIEKNEMSAACSTVGGAKRRV
jgi:hypothetical protein